MPTIHGSIDRRLLVNYTVDSEELDAVLPEPFRATELTEGEGLGQVELMRHAVAPDRRVPRPLRLSSEEASHRIAVEWAEGDEIKQGMYVLRRDTNSSIARIAGHALGLGDAEEGDLHTREFGDGEYWIQMDGDGAFVGVNAYEVEETNGSIFKSVEDAQEFQNIERRIVEEFGDEFVENDFSLEGEMRPLEAVDAVSSLFEGFEGAKFDSAFVTRDGEYELKPKETVTVEM